MNIRILFVGEIVGKAGVFCVKTLLSDVRARTKADFVVANCDGTTGGFGIGRNHSVYLRKLGIDVITTGDQAYFKKDMVEHIEKAYYLLRPANHPPSNPGRGWRYYTVGDRKVAVVSLLGQAGFDRIHLSNPYTFLPELVERIKRETNTIIIDFHATTTAEKGSMFFHADGHVSAVIGTGQRVQTSDARVMPGGTGVICDVGRTGSIDSVGGLEPSIEIQKFLKQVPERSSEAWARPEMHAVVLEIDDDGKTVSIEAYREPCKENPDGGKSTST